MFDAVIAERGASSNMRLNGACPIDLVVWQTSCPYRCSVAAPDLLDGSGKI